MSDGLLAPNVGFDLADGSPWDGGWWIFARPSAARVTDITFFRGAPTLLGQFSFEDPFGPKEMRLTLPTVTVFDRLGYGDLAWLRKKVSIDVIWSGALPAAYPFGRYLGRPAVWMPSFAWEGYTSGFSYGENGVGLTLSLKGGMYQLDDYLAKPEFFTRPLPYEWAMSRQFVHTDRPALRLAPLQVNWPSWWTTTYTPPVKGTPHYMVPAAVKKGDKWTGLLTRSSGSWEPVLTSYLQTMLVSMYTRRGRWSLDLQRGRVPTLTHRNFLSYPTAGTAVVDATSPAVKVNGLEVDWGESLDIAYAQGVSLAGVAYSGMQVSSDGVETHYEPLAYRRQAYPFDDNAWLDLADSPREVLLQMQPGLSEYDAGKVALAHLERFGDPGVTGEVELAGDVTLASGDVIPHYLVRAGMAIRIRHLFGWPEGVMAFVTANTVNAARGTNTLTVDSKFRDALTVEEVKVRGRDSLAISRMLVAGQYTPPIPDQLLPWNYATGSGMVPSAPFRNSRELFDSMPDDLKFPWTKWTTTHPPKSGRWRNCYLEIGPASANADNNWSGRGTGTTRQAIGVRMAQAGTIRLFQFAAYDRDGNVMRVPFHVSFYYMQNTNVGSMPKLPAGESHGTFHAPQHYPFGVDAWETYNTDGTEKGIEIPMPVHTAGLWRAYGTDRVKAGYWPGDGTGTPTGLLVDETTKSFDTTSYGQFNPYTRKGNLTNPDAGMLYVMVYCDAQASESVFFLGRMFRAEPGTQGGGQ